MSFVPFALFVIRKRFKRCKIQITSIIELRIYFDICNVFVVCSFAYYTANISVFLKHINYIAEILSCSE